MAKQSFTVGQVLTAAQMTSLQQTAMLGGSATAKTASYTLVAADAGTVVSVNSTSATTITINSGLFSAGDTVTIQNWGSGSVTITAGTATVNTAGSLIVPQYDGGVLYFTSASAAIYFDFVQAGAVSPLTTKGDLYTFSTSDARLGVGANGTTLVADSSESTGLKWQTPASGALTYITSASPSAVATISIDNCFTSTYRNYLIIANVEATAAGGYQLNARLRAAGTDNTSTNYKWNTIYMGSSAGTVNGDYNNSATFFPFAEVRETGETASTTYLYSPKASVETTFTTNAASLGASASAFLNGGGSMTVTTAYDGFTLYVTSGTFTGTIRVYGVANS